jgi:predicted TIM-barrel fold metal-dependent hydrolase
MSYASINLMNVDTHFHIFEKDSSNKDHSRYSVDYSARIEDWLDQANKQDIAGGVIVQPSFLGFDNSLLIEAIKSNSRLLRGVAVVTPDTTRSDLIALSKQGVRGIRLNFYGDEDPFSTLQRYTELIKLLKGVGMHLQIHHDDGFLNGLLLAIPAGVDIVLDHFGRPKAVDEFENLSAGIDKHRDRLWVKLSAQYRTPNLNHQIVFQYWLNKIGSARLLWGSDWPHTRFEAAESYSTQMNRFQSLCAAPEIKDQILSANPKALYWS